MSLKFNGTTVENVVYNGTNLCKLVYNGTLVWENHAYGSWTTTTAATCTATGSKKRTCTRTGCGVSETQSIPATGHSYGMPMYFWSGYTSCTATRVCSNDNSHKENATATITSKVTTLATCTTAGVRTYTATFSKSWADAQTKTETIAATGHKSSDWIIDSEATTLGAGSKHKECTVCGTVLETATIPKLEPLTYTLLSGGTYSVKATDVHVSGAITIPSTYNGKAVTRVEANAFKGCTNIRSVSMPNSITYIGDRAFNTCTLMNTITMSNSVTYIGFRAFAGCHSLTTGVTIPASVTTIGAYAFEGCDKLLKVTFEHRKWNAGSTSVTVTAFNGATLLKTTYVSVAWTKVDTVETGTYQLFTYPEQVDAYEFIDTSFGTGEVQPTYWKPDEFLAGGYLENNNGVVVPVLYKTNYDDYAGEVDTQEAFFYVGNEYNSILGGTYAKWRKIEISTDSNEFTWTSSCIQYVYTYPIVSNNRFMDGIFQ